MAAGELPMAKIIAAALALYSAFLIQSSLPILPSRIPVHFNAAGQPNGWGSPQTLWVMLVFQLLVVGAVLSIPFLSRKFPASVHLGTQRFSDLTPEQRGRALPLLDKMGGWMSVATSLFFVFLIRESIRAAESSHPQFHAGWAAVLFVGGMVGVAFYYLRRINKAAQAAEG
jgi:Domain of unknown function (DUF1648)